MKYSQKIALTRLENNEDKLELLRERLEKQL